jgi:hypothetical protein
MENSPANARNIAYAVIIIGCALAAMDAVQPQLGHYKLMFGTLLLGILPYLVYGVLSDILRPRALLVVGAVILGIDVLVRVAGLSHGTSGVGWLLWGYDPLWLAIVPLAAVAVGQYDLPERERPASEAEAPPH